MGTLLSVLGLLLAYLGVAQSAKWFPFADSALQTAAAEIDGTYPSLECREELTVVDVARINDLEGEEIAYVELRRTTTCGAAYVWVENHLDDVTIVKTIERPTTSELPGNLITTSDYTEIAEGVFMWTYSAQLLAPDCVTYRVTIEKRDGTVVGELPTRKAC